MKYYPVNLNIQDRHCLVVGGGSVGARKVRGLIRCGARVTLVSPVATEDLIEMAETGRITWHRRAYQASDLEGIFLVIGATDDENLNRRVHADADRRQLLCNIADRPEICNFILPAVVRREDLIVAVSTSGKSPAYAKRLRKELENQFGPEYGVFLRLMGSIRTRLLAQAHAPEAHKPLFEQIIDGGLVELIRRENVAEIDALLTRVLGDEFVYADLITNAQNR